MIDDQENTAKTAMVEYPGIEMQIERTELSLEKVGEITTGIVIDIMIGTVAMTVIVIEIMTAPVAMIQEGTGLVPGSTGAMTDTEAAEELGDFGVVSSLDMAIMFVLRYCHAM